MDHYLSTIRDEIPEHLHPILDWDFIPWNYVKHRHGDHPNTPLIALFESWLQISDILDLETITSLAIPAESGGCMRCGSCCAYKRPGAVSGKTYRRWQKTGIPVALFHSPVLKGKTHSTYNCWYHNGTRLRICPFLLVNRIDSMPFCSIHHMGRDYRPRACSRFVPNPPVCQTGDFVPVY